MEPLSPGSSRRTRLVLVALALFVLVVIVGFASRTGFGRSSNAAPSQAFVSYAFTVFLILFVLAIPISAWAFLVQAREGLGPERPPFRRAVIQNLLTFGFLIGTLALVLWLRRHHYLDFRHPRDAALRAAAKRRRRNGGQDTNAE